MIHLSRSSASLDSTLLLPTTLTGSSILPSASIAGRQSPRLASSRLVQVEKVSVASLTSTICSTSALCSVMWRVVVGRGLRQCEVKRDVLNHLHYVCSVLRQRNSVLNQVLFFLNHIHRCDAGANKD